MKHVRARSLPHPLLTPLSDDVTPNTFELNCPPGSVGADNTHWYISARIHHQCPRIQEFVDKGAAQFGIHVECPRTFFRGWFPQQSTDVKISLPATTVRGRVELLAFCVATSDIPNYQLPGQHADYNKTSFGVRAGDFLAIARHVEFDAFLDLDPIRKISSILDIRKSAERETGPACIDFFGNRIEIELSQEDFRYYMELRADFTVRGLLANGVVFPAVLQAINYLFQLKKEELEEAKNQQSWCRCLIARLEKDGVPLDAGPEKVFRAAQEILREPISRGLADLLADWRE
ncbi:MAG: hypothetical protein ABSD57_13375 [Verrucomicrobiota bacterium]|jgi:hypothetical protein